MWFAYKLWHPVTYITDFNPLYKVNTMSLLYSNIQLNCISKSVHRPLNKLIHASTNYCSKIESFFEWTQIRYLSMCDGM